MTFSAVGGGNVACKKAARIANAEAERWTASVDAHASVEMKPSPSGPTAAAVAPGDPPPQTCRCIVVAQLPHPV